MSDPGYLHISGLKKHFGSVAAVDGIDLSIGRGEMFALLGGSGSGKTTLLRLLAGFEQPDTGSITLDGQDLANIPPHHRPVNLMFQSYALFPHMNVAANIAYGLKMEQPKLARTDIAERVAEALRMVRLEGYDKRRTDQLSGGQRQRVALARALVKRPKLLLLDEPLGALDRKLREQTQLELVRIQNETRITFIIVTHDQDEALQLSDRIAVMDHGKIVQIDTPRQIYHHPASAFVADFIGSVNLFDGQFTNDRDFTIPALQQTLTIAVPPANAAGKMARLAIRPEHIHLLSPQETPADHHFAARIRDIAFMGDHSRVAIETEGGMIVRATIPQNAINPNLVCGEAVHFGWQAADQQIFMV